MRRSFLIAAVAALAAASAAPATAGEPQVAFTVDDGRVSLALTRDDQPVADAQVQVYAADGHRFADCETVADGRTYFPLPPGPDFRVEIKVEDRWADPIRLTPIGDHVVPTNVLLSFGLTPCCRVPSRSGHWPSDPDADLSYASLGTLPVWAQAGGGVLFNIVGMTILVLACRRPTVPTHNNHRRNPDDRPN